jgi:DNA-binding MarR family transcriptional regulator/N-acetylglutamate synthase-like GNAT family acetyltransferase
MNRPEDSILKLGYLAGATRLRRIGEKLQAEGDKLYQEEGIDFKASWFATYYTLLQAGKPLTMQEITNAIGFTHITVKNIARELEKHGIVKIKPNPTDARSKHVSLTHKGQQLLTKLNPIWQKLSESLHELMIVGHPDFMNMINRIEHEMARLPLHQRIYQKNKTVVKIIDHHPGLKKYFFELAGNWLLKVLDGKLEAEDKFSLEQPEKAYLEKGGFVFYALVDNKVAGCTALKRLDDTRFEFCKLFVDPEIRKSGIATQLIERCISRCMENNAAELWLQTTLQAKNAHPLYNKLGFKDAPAPTSMDVLKRTEKIMVLRLKQS